MQVAAAPASPPRAGLPPNGARTPPAPAHSVRELRTRTHQHGTAQGRQSARDRRRDSQKPRADPGETGHGTDGTIRARPNWRRWRRGRRQSPFGQTRTAQREHHHETSRRRPVRRAGAGFGRRRPVVVAGRGRLGLGREPDRYRRRHRAVRHRRARRRARGPARTPGARAHARRAGGRGMAARDEPGLPAAARRLLARRVRLAGPGAPAQPARAVQDHHRRPRHPLRAPPVGRARCVPADPDPRLAGDLRGVRQGHRAPDRPRRPRRARRRRLPRRGRRPSPATGSRTGRRGWATAATAPGRSSPS